MSTEPPVEGVGAAVRQARERQSLSRRELADRSGLSYPYLAQIEAGDRQPSTKALVRIAEALGLRASELLAASEDDLTLSLQAPEAALSPSPMQRWVPAPAAAPPPRRSQSPAGGGTPRRELAELMLLAAELSPADLTLVLELARRLAR